MRPGALRHARLEAISWLRAEAWRQAPEPQEEEIVICPACGHPVDVMQGIHRVHATFHPKCWEEIRPRALPPSPPPPPPLPSCEARHYTLQLPEFPGYRFSKDGFPLSVNGHDTYRLKGMADPQGGLTFRLRGADGRTRSVGLGEVLHRLAALGVLALSGCSGWQLSYQPTGRPVHVHTAACRPPAIVSTPWPVPAEKPPHVRFLDPEPIPDTPPVPPAIESLPVGPVGPLPPAAPLPEPTPAVPLPSLAPGRGERVLQARSEEGGDR